MRVHGKRSAYEITQELVDLMKGKPLRDYPREVLDDNLKMLAITSLITLQAKTTSFITNSMVALAIGAHFDLFPVHMK